MSVLTRRKKVTYSLAIVLSVLYLVWRVFFTIPWHASLFVLLFALALVISEIISNFTAFVLVFFRILDKKGHFETFTASGYPANTALPDVDILIVTHNESAALLSKTVNAATYIHYPAPGQKNIVICDDQNRPEIAALAQQYHVQYISMTDNQHAKSGNINHALKQLKAPLFAIFDADMIPFSHFLDETVPYFLQNFINCQNNQAQQKLGFIQTPQSFYNADIFQFNLFLEKSVTNEQDFFSRDVNVMNGHNHTALFTGSNALFLRSAVAKVGWFPTDTITEDFELGTKLNIAGYASIATAKPQSSGTTPTDLKGVMRQRTRWARGVIQSCQNLHIFLNPKIPLRNRIILINTYFYWWSFMRRLIYITAPLLYALFKLQVVDANFWVLMGIWAPGYFLLHFVLGDTSNQIRNERWGEIQETFFAPFLFLPVLLETLHIRARKFKVTAKQVTTSWRDRLYAIPYFSLWALTLVAIVKFNYGKWGSEIIVGSVITFWLLMHFMNLSFCLFIALGRPIYRKSERFVRKLPATIQLEGSKEWLPIQTVDVSDDGLSFQLLDAKTVLSLHQPFIMKLAYHDLAIQLRGEVVRQIKTDEGVQCSGATVQPQNLSSQNGYFQIIYDGYNQLLPTQQDTWITPFDALNMNLIQRAQNLQRRLSFFKVHH